MKTQVRLIVTSAVLGCIALFPKAYAVSPPPDGGYPGGNTAEGQNALLSRTTGGFNTALGWFSLKSLTTGSFNTAVGAGTLVLNSGDENTATGVGALFSNTTGNANTANGAAALFYNTTGGSNVATGFFALLNNTAGFDNTAIGVDAAVNNDTGNSNTGIGFEVLDSNTTGNDNTAIGALALAQNTGGSDNIAVGLSAGDQITTASHVICIGAAGANVDNGCYIGHIFGGTVPGGATVIVDSNGHLGTIVSSQRFKDQIKPMDEASQALFSLKPVSFRYNKEIDPTGTSQLGLVAEDVDKVNPDLVVRDKEGKPYSVRYEQVNAMLLNEFLKEHRTVQEQGATIAELKKEITVLATTVREQSAQIQKVSARVEMTEPSAKVVVNNP